MTTTQFLRKTSILGIHFVESFSSTYSLMNQVFLARTPLKFQHSACALKNSHDSQFPVPFLISQNSETIKSLWKD